MIVAAGYRWAAGPRPGCVVGTTRHGAVVEFRATFDTYRSTDALCRAIVQATEYFWPVRAVPIPLEDTDT